MIQCINTYCLKPTTTTDSDACEKCGAPLYINDRLLPTKILSNSTNPFSPARTQTFEATELASNQPVILRVVHSNEEKLVQPLTDAVLALRCIHALSDHPGIVRLAKKEAYFTWRIRNEDASEAHCMVTQKIEGDTLQSWTKEHGKIDEILAIKWLRQLVNAISALHEQGYIHRDIKPENIIVEPNQNLVLIDFDAICRMEQAAEQEIPSMGTPRYMAKEQATGNPRPSSDLYSIGMVIAELLAGEIYSKISRHNTRTELGKVKWPKSVQISNQLKDLLSRMTHPNILSRPVSAKEVLSILDSSKHWVCFEEQNQLVSTTKRPLITRKFLILSLFLTALLTGISAVALSQSQSEADKLLAEGNQLIVSGNTEQGAALIERGVKLEPDSAELRNSLALAQSSMGDAAAAIESYETALQLSPQNPYILYNLASAYEAVDMERAIAYYTTSTQIDSPIQTSALNGLARAYLLTDKLQDAQEILSTLTEQIDNSAIQPTLKMAVLKNTAWANFQSGDFESAKEHLDRAMDADPTQPDTYCLSALIQQELGQENYSDKTTCLLLPVVVDKPELRNWKAQLLSSQGQ